LTQMMHSSKIQQGKFPILILIKKQHFISKHI
jgi:hypothetical protein